MSIALIGSGVNAGSADTNTVTTGTYDTTGATLMVVFVGDWAAATLGTVSDSQSNTWTPLTTRESATPRGKLYYVANPSTNASHTVTYTVTAGYPYIGVLAFSGTDTSSPFDQESGSTTDSGITLQPGSITPAADNYVLVIGILNNASGTDVFSIDSSFTKQLHLDNAPGAHFPGATGYQIQTTATARNPTWDWTAAGNTYAATAMASFKVAAGGGAATLRQWRMGRLGVQ